MQTRLMQLLGKDGFRTTVVEDWRGALEWLRNRSEDPCAILLEGELNVESSKKFLEVLEKEFPSLFSTLPIIFSRRKKDSAPFIASQALQL